MGICHWDRSLITAPETPKRIPVVFPVFHGLSGNLGLFGKYRDRQFNRKVFSSEPTHKTKSKLVKTSKVYSSQNGHISGFVAVLMALSLLHTYILLTPTATLSKSWYLS